MMILLFLLAAVILISTALYSVQVFLDRGHAGSTLPPEDSAAAFRAAALVSIAQNINSHLSLDGVIGQIVGYAGPMLSADGAFVFLTSEGGTLDLASGWWKEHVFASEDLRGVAEYCSGRGTALRFPAPTLDFTPGYPGMAAPIVAYDHWNQQPRNFGVLLCIRKTGDARFESEDLDFLSSFADQVAIAVRNAELHEQLQKANRRLLELDQLKTEFLEIVAHDIRSPLGAFVGLLEQLLADERQRTMPVEERERVLQHLIERAMRVAHAATDSLSIAQIESGEMIIRAAEVKVQDLLQALDVRPTENRRVLVDVPEDFPPVLLDDERLREVLNNLLGNAFKFSPKGGEVRLEARIIVELGRRFLRVTVSDHGIGFTPELQRHLFRKFTKGEPAEGTDDGTGLGLYICRKIVEAMHGRITAHSDGPGLGAAFRVEIPVELAGKSEIRMPERPDPAEAPGDKTEANRKMPAGGASAPETPAGEAVKTEGC